jgi:hypothetical protein
MGADEREALANLGLKPIEGQCHLDTEDQKKTGGWVAACENCGEPTCLMHLQRVESPSGEREAARILCTTCALVHTAGLIANGVQPDPEAPSHDIENIPWGVMLDDLAAGKITWTAIIREIVPHQISPDDRDMLQTVYSKISAAQLVDEAKAELLRLEKASYRVDAYRPVSSTYWVVEDKRLNPRIDGRCFPLAWALMWKYGVPFASGGVRDPRNAPKE